MSGMKIHNAFLTKRIRQVNSLLHHPSTTIWVVVRLFMSHGTPQGITTGSQGWRKKELCLSKTLKISSLYIHFQENFQYLKSMTIYMIYIRAIPLCWLSTGCQLKENMNKVVHNFKNFCFVFLKKKKLQKINILFEIFIIVCGNENDLWERCSFLVAWNSSEKLNLSYSWYTFQNNIGISTINFRLKMRKRFLLTQ